MSIENLPAAFLARLNTILPPERLADTLETFVQTPATGFRINTLRASRDSVLAALTVEGLTPQPVAWYEDAFWIPPDQRAALLASAAYRQQQIWIQNLSSMVPPLVLAPQPGEDVLDLAAAPGSKTLQMACLMQNEGHIAAVEVVRKRFFQLQTNLKQQGAQNVRTFLKDGTQVWRNRPEFFHRVLLDAPCSTEARFRTDDPETYRYWRVRKVYEMAHKQKELLISGLKCLQPGGTLVYSTCSFAPEENEGVLTQALDFFCDEVELVPLAFSAENQQPCLTEWDGAPFHPSVRHALRILPTPQMEGFFVAKLHKKAY